MLAVKKFQFLRAGKPPSPGSCNYFFFGAAAFLAVGVAFFAGAFFAGAFLAGAFVADGATIGSGDGVVSRKRPFSSRGICSAALRRARLARKSFRFLNMRGVSVLVFCQGGGL